MTVREQIQREISKAPAGILRKILQVVVAEKHRRQPQVTITARMAEKALAKDWLRPEEDRAWRDL